MRLSKDFTLDEFVRSGTAKAHGIDNTPPQPAVANLGALARAVLQPIRDYLQRPVKISSGYRCQALNRAVGSASTSQHTQGQAADIFVDDMQLLPYLYDWIVWDSDIDFDQAIYEPARGVIHISHVSGGGRQNRREALIEFRRNMFQPVEDRLMK